MKNANKNDIIHQFLTDERFSLLRHSVLIVAILVVTLSFVWYTPLTEVPEYYRYYAWGVYIALFGGVIYANIYACVPRLLLKDKLTKYVISLFIFVLVIMLNILILQVFLLKKTPQDEFNLLSFLSNISSACFILIFLLLGTTSVVLIKYWALADIKRSELETSALQSELKLLKNQVNPHFLFNMLNNANMLLKKDKEQASDVLFKLEDLLRYQISDSAREEVLLSSDIKFLNDYLNLEKIRRDRFEYQIHTIGGIEHVKVPPLLFIIFVENAVKHNPDNEQTSYVNIEFKLSENELYFKCENSKPELSNIHQSEEGGLGLKNVKRRLKLLFPSKYNLQIREQNLKYTVTLKLIL